MFWVMLRSYAPYVVWPAAAVIGFIGYHMESKIRGYKESPYKALSIADEREERHLSENKDKDPTKVETLELKNFQPKTIFERKTSK